MNSLRHVPLIWTLLAAGCSTSQEARELATETAGAIQTLDAELTRTAAAAKHLSDARVRAITRLIRRTAEGQADLQAEVDASSARAVYAELRSYIEEQEKNRQKNLANAEAAASSAAGAQQVWKAPSESLRRVSDHLTTLGRQETVWGRLKFTGKFVKEVAERVSANRKQAEEAASKSVPEPAQP